MPRHSSNRRYTPYEDIFKLLVISIFGLSYWLGGPKNFIPTFVSLTIYTIVGTIIFFVIWAYLRLRHRPAPLPENHYYPRTPEKPLAPPAPPISELLRAIDWFQFEKVICRILEYDGYHVLHNGGARPDGGADIIAHKNGQKTVVQCKHWQRWPIKPPTLRELQGTKSSAEFMADAAMFFSLSDYTEAAIRFACQNGILYYTRDDIVLRIKQIGLQSFPELLNPEVKTCPRCGANMVLRKGNFPSFWGCSHYPRCRERINISH